MMIIASILIQLIFNYTVPTINPLQLQIENLLIPIFVFLIGTDILKMELPDGVNLFICGLGLIYAFTTGQTLLHLFTGILLFIIFIAIGYTGGMGGGDIKYAGAFGLFMVPMQIIFFLWVSFMTALIFAIIVMVFLNQKDKKYAFPFGPFLILSSFYILLFY